MLLPSVILPGDQLGGGRALRPVVRVLAFHDPAVQRPGSELARRVLPGAERTSHRSAPLSQSGYQFHLIPPSCRTYQDGPNGLSISLRPRDVASTSRERERPGSEMPGTARDRSIPADRQMLPGKHRPITDLRECPPRGFLGRVHQLSVLAATRSAHHCRPREGGTDTRACFRISSRMPRLSL